jgi:hypothetical protein
MTEIPRFAWFAVIIVGQILSCVDAEPKVSNKRSIKRNPIFLEKVIVACCPPNRVRRRHLSFGNGTRHWGVSSTNGEQLILEHVNDEGEHVRRSTSHTGTYK